MSGQGAGLIAPQRMVEAPLEFRLRSGGQQSGSDALIICPKCDAPAFIRRSERVNETVKHLIAHCTNSGCGHIFKSEISFIHSLVEGNIARPDLDLAVCAPEEVVHVLPPRGSSPPGQSSFLTDTEPLQTA